MLKYLIAVKFESSREVEIYEFGTEEDRTIFTESLRYRDDVQDITYSQIEETD